MVDIPLELNNDRESKTNSERKAENPHDIIACDVDCLTFMMPPVISRISKGKWHPDSMKQAVENMLTGQLSIRKAAEMYKIPKSTLIDRVSAVKRGKEITFTPALGRFKPMFNAEFEGVLLDHVKDLSDRLLPLTRKEFLNLAFQLAETLKIPDQFNRDKKTAGKQFYYDSMNRHPNLSLRTPESTSLNRSIGFNKPEVNRFFKRLTNLMEKYEFTPYKIYNCDETSVTTVQKHSKVISLKQNRQVGKLTSAERGRSVTVLFCMNAGGQYTPPFFIFPRQRMNERLLTGAPKDSIGEAQSNGWMTSQLFLKWMQHFAHYANPSVQNPVLLILDGHISHKDLEVITYARNQNIHMLSTPPHTTHKLQPLDRVFMKPFKDAYYEACGLWMRKNPAARITEYEIASLVGDAFARVSRAEIAVKGFQCTGIHPLNPNVFTELDYLPSMMTDIAMDSNVDQTESPIVRPMLPLPDMSSAAKASSHHETSPNRPTPTDRSNDTTVVKETIQQLSPIPDASKKREVSRRRKSERSEVLTSSPYKTYLEEKNNEKLKRKVKSLVRGKRPLSGKFFPKSSRKTTKKNDKKEETTCIFCGESHDEDWIQCSSCQMWAHEACASIPETSDKY
ncbi:hypothetical protein ANN_25247 [Periplaneta americana]|uniref:Uncharacterized protein n=1 Tax=Periplaneta americana TaxID=6978 RepID=A0ABQ8S0T7_PERAM|nr:hypothetical protein ANN_25247 [Periplaneta americana]